MLKAYIEFLRNLILSIPFNIFDYIIFVTLILYIFEDISFGIIPAAIGLAATLLSFFAGLLLYPYLSSLIVEKFSLIKDSIRNSITGRFLFTRTPGMEREVRKVFGGAIEETINFLTIKPQSQESIRLNFTTTSFKIDPKSEKTMLEL